MCDDKTKFKAHKFVLNACSPVFKTIIDDLQQLESSVIYLRGVLAQEIKPILDRLHYMYQDRILKSWNQRIKQRHTLQFNDEVEDDENIQSYDDNLFWVLGCIGVRSLYLVTWQKIL